VRCHDFAAAAADDDDDETLIFIDIKIRTAVIYNAQQSLTR